VKAASPGFGKINGCPAAVAPRFSTFSVHRYHRNLSAPDEFTGERFLPGIVGEIAYEHCHRYAFARRFVAGRRVLDAASGEGYGAALLASVAQSVTGVDIAPRVVADAAARYGQHGNVIFEAASVTRLPLRDASVDAIVSFETSEHLPAGDQPQMLAEFARVLAPGGILILSSPNRPQYSDARDYSNPFHLCELDRDELAQRLGPAFAHRQWFGQRRYLGSAIWSDTPGERFEALSGSAVDVRTANAPAALYYIVIAAPSAEALPGDAPALSLYADGDDTEWARIDREAREVLRLDGLVRTRDEELRAQHRAVEELRAMVEHRNKVIVERDRVEAALRADFATALDAERAAHAAERKHLVREIESQQRIVAYRASIRWWLRLPLVRARGVWTRIRAA
jgi:SAM-dependent methyltransferase